MDTYQLTAPATAGQITTTASDANGMVAGQHLSIEEVQQLLQKLEHDVERKTREVNCRNSELALVNRVTQVFNSIQDLDQILVTVLEEVRRLLEVVACSIWLRDQETNELICEYAIGPFSQTVRGWRLEEGQGIAGVVAQTGKTVIVPDVLTDERHFKGIDEVTGQVLRSILCVPMKAEQQIIGVLQVLDTDANRFTATDQTLQELLATAASIAIANTRLHEQLRQEASKHSLLLHEFSQRGHANLKTVVELLTFLREAEDARNAVQASHLFNQLRDRVNTLSIVHELLRDSAWKPLYLHDLGLRIVYATLQMTAAAHQMHVLIPDTPIQIPPQHADKIALILHELALNTVKYALSAAQQGNIVVHFAQEADYVQIEFRDNGPGYPDAVLRGEAYQPGLALVQHLIQDEFSGTFTLYNDNGAVAMLRLKDLSPNQKKRPCSSAKTTADFVSE